MSLTNNFHHLIYDQVTNIRNKCSMIFHNDVFFFFCQGFNAYLMSKLDPNFYSYQSVA